MSCFILMYLHLSEVEAHNVIYLPGIEIRICQLLNSVFPPTNYDVVLGMFVNMPITCHCLSQEQNRTEFYSLDHGNMRNMQMHSIRGVGHITQWQIDVHT